jgi:hypothetical protein
MPSYRVDVPPEAHVIRFRPTDPNAVLGHAITAYNRTGIPGLSVFADIAHDGEDQAATVNRLVATANFTSINARVFVTTASAILEKGFCFTKDDVDDEHSEHYSVDIGKADLDSVVRFLDVFEDRRRHGSEG